MTWARRLYPALFAIFPVLGVAARNPGYYRVADAVVLSLIAIAGVVIVWAIVYGFLRVRLRHEAAADGAALAAVVGVALFYAYPPLQRGRDYLVQNPRMGPAIVIASIVGLMGALLVAHRLGLLRRAPPLRDVGRFLSLVATLLVVGSLGQIVYYRVTGALAIRRSALVRELARPVPLRRVASLHGTGAMGPIGQPKRDIYILVLDEYPAADVLRERFGFDNRPFEDSLRALGFRLPRELRSNYANTLMSVSSFLNFAHTQPLAEVMNPRSSNFGPAAYLMEHNRAERFLKHQGYRFVFFPSSWYGPTQSNDDADEQFDPDSDLDIGRALQRSELASYFAAVTPVRALLPHLATAQEVHARDAASAFAGIAQVPSEPQPTFTLAHILMPHVPYIEDARCQPLPRGASLERHDDPAGRAALASEMACLNGQILATVHTLIARSNPKPIIILQGDHGTQALGIFVSSRTLPTVAQARERFRPFGAYYLPDGGAAALPDSLSLVNVLRYVFGYYFNADLPPLQNTMYYSHWHYPYGLTQVGANFHVIRPGDRDAGRAVATEAAR